MSKLQDPHDSEVDALAGAVGATMAVLAWLVTVWLGPVVGGVFVALIVVAAVFRCWRTFQ